MDKQQPGRFTIPTRVYLSAEERAKLEHLIRSEELDLGELLSELLAGYLADKPLPTATAPTDVRSDLRRRRDEARRLATTRASRQQTPGWFDGYMTQLDREVRRLEREANED